MLFLVQLLNYSKAVQAQVAKLQMAEPGAGRQHVANCRHCHVHCHSVADRVCGARWCWQGQEHTRVWHRSSGLMKDKTKPESAAIVKPKSTNAPWNYHRISVFSWQTAYILHRVLSLVHSSHIEVKYTGSAKMLLWVTVFFCLLAWCNVLDSCSSMWWTAWPDQDGITEC